MAISFRLLVLLTAALAAASANARNRLVEGFPDLPLDARQVAERSLACQHFWGEISGTGDERDQEVTRQLSQLKCDRVAADLQAIRTKYRRDPVVSGILLEAVIE